MEAYQQSYPIHVINLQRSVERKKSFVKNNQHLKYNFFPAFDGKTLGASLLNSDKLFLHPLPFPSLGAFGCALSHFTLWKLAMQNNLAITIAEDDAIFRDDFVTASANLIESLPKDWDMVYWGWNLDAPLVVSIMGNAASALLSFDQNAIVKKIDAFRISKEPATALKLSKCFGIPAYTISPQGAKKFIEQCFPIKNTYVVFPLLNKYFSMTGVDMAMNLILSDTQSYVAFPPLVVTPNDHGISTIQRPDSL